MKYFVTGATGFVGGELVRQLRAAGHEVHCSVRSIEKASELKKLGVTLSKGDVTDKESMREGMLGTDGVFHVAGWYKLGARDKSGGEQINIRGSRNVFELMRELKIPKGVYTSTLAVNSDTHGLVVDESYRFTGKHLSEYDRTKAAAHDIANEFIANGLPLVIVQPGLIYGPGDTSSLRVNLIDFLRGKPTMLPTQTKFCWAHVADVAHAHILAMEKGKPGESYIIAGEPYRVIEAFNLAAEVSGKRAPLQIPYQAMKLFAACMPPFDTWAPESYTSEGLRAISGTTYLGDNSKAKRELGYNPRPMNIGWVETVKHEMKLLGMTPGPS